MSIPVRAVAVAAAYPTEAEARHALATDLAPGVVLGRYLGLWLMPVEGSTPVHLFTDADPEWLRLSGWSEVEA